MFEGERKGDERETEKERKRERERERERENERKRERVRERRERRIEIKSFCVPWSVFVAGFQFSGLMMGRHTCPFSSMLGW